MSTKYRHRGAAARWFSPLALGLVACFYANAGVPLDDLPRRSAEAYCDKVLRCGGVFAARYGGDRDTCLQELAAQSGLTQQDLLVVAATAGQARYDGRQAAGCLFGYGVSECEPLGVGGLPYCPTMGQGLVAVGQSCTQDLVCETGWCDQRSACPGVCAAPLARDAACDYVVPCSPGQDCIDERCADVSTDVLPGGATCDARFLTGRCAYGHTCDSITSTCTPLPGSGEACAWLFGCGPGLLCGQTGVCELTKVASAAGEPCSEIRGPFCDRSRGLACQRDVETSADLVCAPAAQQGEVCEGPDAASGRLVSTPCDTRQPLFCDAGGRCRSLGTTGSPCQAPSECKSRICDAATNRCLDYHLALCLEGGQPFQ